MESYGPPRLHGKVNLKRQYSPSRVPLSSPRKGSYTLSGGDRDLPRERATNSSRHNPLSPPRKGSYTLSGGHRDLPFERVTNSPKHKRLDNKLDQVLLPGLTEETHSFPQKPPAAPLEDATVPFDYRSCTEEEQQYFHENQENIPPNDYQPPVDRRSLFDYRVKIGTRERKAFGEIDISELGEVDEGGFIVNPEIDTSNDLKTINEKDDGDLQDVHTHKKLALSPLNVNEDPSESYDVKRPLQIHISSTPLSNTTKTNLNNCLQDEVIHLPPSPIPEDRTSKALHSVRKGTAFAVWEDPNIASSEEVSDQNDKEQSDDDYYDEYDELSSFDNDYNDLYDSPFLRRLRASIFDGDRDGECDTSFATTVSDVTVAAKSAPKRDTPKSPSNSLSPVAVKSIFWTGDD